MPQNTSYETMFAFDQLATKLKNDSALQELCLEKHAMMKKIYNIVTAPEFNPLANPELGFIQSFEQYFIEEFIGVIQKKLKENKELVDEKDIDDQLNSLSTNIKKFSEMLAARHPQPSSNVRGIVSTSDSSISQYGPKLMSFYGHADLQLLVARKFKYHFLRSNQTEYTFTIHSVPPPSNPRKEKPAEDEEPIAYARTAYREALKWCKDSNKIKIVYNNGIVFKPSQEELNTWMEESKNGPNLSKMAEDTLTRFVDNNLPAIENHPRLFRP